MWRFFASLFEPKHKAFFMYHAKLKGEAWPEPPAEKGKLRICLLLIDPQNDFVLPTGSLSVPGAKMDCDRLAEAISRDKDKIADVFVTLDTHERYHIAHPLFWVDDSGNQPAPFTTIEAKDVGRDKKWRTARPEHQEWAQKYVAGLEAGKRFNLTIWPEHCLIGTEGHAVYKPLQDALHEWEGQNKKTTSYVMKGNNAFTEHYSAIKAEVSMPDDPRTLLNSTLINQLLKYDRIIVAGEALSHCVNFTVRDFVENIDPENLQKIFIVSNACSSVTGFEEAGEAFKEDMAKKGIRFVPCSQILA